MIEYNLIPQKDYIDICNAIREKDGSTDKIVSGDLGAKIRAIKSGSNTLLSTGTLKLVSDTKITVDAPLVIAHNLGAIPNIFILVVKQNPRTNTGKHDFFNITAIETENYINVKGSYYNGRYPELYVLNEIGKISSQSPHTAQRATMDVWGATETEIKLGAIRDGGATIPQNIEYIWIAISS